ncbi:hypothetical protein VNO77_44794 [Canavalia gladiata]|uniref:Uncharacterized protein n=1 Tax=Canavalia gladiata TaxID=3824 RepID=A0AAN9K0A9_CANGL
MRPGNGSKPRIPVLATPRAISFEKLRLCTVYAVVSLLVVAAYNYGMLSLYSASGSDSERARVSKWIAHVTGSDEYYACSPLKAYHQHHINCRAS